MNNKKINKKICLLAFLLSVGAITGTMVNRTSVVSAQELKIDGEKNNISSPDFTIKQDVDKKQSNNNTNEVFIYPKIEGNIRKLPDGEGEIKILPKKTEDKKEKLEDTPKLPDEKGYGDGIRPKKDSEKSKEKVKEETKKEKLDKLRQDLKNKFKDLVDKIKEKAKGINGTENILQNLDQEVNNLNKNLDADNTEDRLRQDFKTSKENVENYEKTIEDLKKHNEQMNQPKILKIEEDKDIFPQGYPKGREELIDKVRNAKTKDDLTNLLKKPIAGKLDDTDISELEKIFKKDYEDNELSSKKDRIVDILSKERGDKTWNGVEETPKLPDEKGQGDDLLPKMEIPKQKMPKENDNKKVGEDKSANKNDKVEENKNPNSDKKSEENKMSEKKEEPKVEENKNPKPDKKSEENKMPKKKEEPKVDKTVKKDEKKVKEDKITKKDDKKVIDNKTSEKQGKKSKENNTSDKMNETKSSKEMKKAETKKAEKEMKLPKTQVAPTSVWGVVLGFLGAFFSRKNK
ncbi:MAG: hypothetical protein PT934_02015 [Peptoniphilaceae bacterium]|uniref:hypothetical protein n=1 Tax=Parvimonas sp. TaxID=1944660 RepID=UPI002A7475FD|nr:hypothetical protein [Parvimonas sp.]MDD7764524.1 hypothetical protein [Peptoniphilaceae bacterium]MDY3050458.1 hypothetical protein [Parvimonas sp.]